MKYIYVINEKPIFLISQFSEKPLNKIVQKWEIPPHIQQNIKGNLWIIFSIDLFTRNSERKFDYMIATLNPTCS